MKSAIAALLGAAVVASGSSMESEMEVTMHALRAGAREVPPDPSHMALPKVPKVVNAGADGLPELPSVSSMLHSAAETLNVVNNEAAELQKKMLRVQKSNEERLQKRKAVFDHKLKEQEQKNKAVITENAQAAKKIMALKNTNQALFTHAKQLQQSNEQRRVELQLYGEQLVLAEKFVQESMAGTDDSEATELEVLSTDAAGKSVSLLSVHKKQLHKVVKHPAHHPMEDEDEDTDPLSFLELDSETYSEPSETDAPDAATPEVSKDAVEPESLVEFLAKGVQKMQEEGKATEARLKELFLQNFEAGLTRHKALMEQKQVLNETLEHMTAYEKRLQVAVKHLTATKTNIDKKIHGVGVHLSKLATLALASPDAAAETMKSLKALKQSQEAKNTKTASTEQTSAE
jgi:hypothetical protein